MTRAAELPRTLRITCFGGDLEVILGNPSGWLEMPAASMDAVNAQITENKNSERHPSTQLGAKAATFAPIS